MAHRALLKRAGNTVALELPAALAAGWNAGSSVNYIPYGNDAGFFCRGDAPPGFFAGSLRSFSVEEVFGHATSGMRSGVLIIYAKQFRKSVNFRDGQLTFATSTEPHERLGAALVRRKLLTTEQLKKALAKVKLGTRLGQVLTQTGLTSAASLYTAMADLICEIVLGLFSLTEGHFVFFEGPPPPDAVKLPKRTRELMLEGVKLADELKRSGAQKPVSGKKEPRAKPASTPVPSVLELYGALIETICRALRNAGKDLTDLRSFFEDPLPGMEQAFAQVRLGEDGKFDVEQVMKNTRADEEVLGRVKAYEALDSFVSYALFSAKNSLSAELAESLAKKFRKIQDELQV